MAVAVRTRSRQLSLIFCALWLTSNLLAAAPTAAPRVAVLDFEYAGDTSASKDVGRAAAMIMEASLADRCELLDRTAIQTQMDSLRLAPGQPISYYKLQQLGRALSAQYLVTGSIIKLSSVLVVARLHNANTGDVLALGRADCKTPEQLDAAVASASSKFLQALPAAAQQTTITAVAAAAPAPTVPNAIGDAVVQVPPLIARPKTEPVISVSSATAVKPEDTVVKPLLAVLPPEPLPQSPSLYAAKYTALVEVAALRSAPAEPTMVEPPAPVQVASRNLTSVPSNLAAPSASAGSQSLAGNEDDTAAQAAAGMTVLQLMRKAERQVTALGRANVLRIESEREQNSLFPPRWVFYFYDPSATFKCKRVTLDYGRVTSVDVQSRWFLLDFDPQQVIHSRQLRVDSDRALELARDLPPLQGVAIGSTEFALRRTDRRDNSGYWEIKIWQQLASGRERYAGWVRLSASSGQIYDSNLSVRR